MFNFVKNSFSLSFGLVAQRIAERVRKLQGLSTSLIRVPQNLSSCLTVNSHCKYLLVKYGRDIIGIDCQIHTKHINAMCGNIQSFLCYINDTVNVFVFVCVCVCVCACVRAVILEKFCVSSCFIILCVCFRHDKKKFFKIYYTSNFLLLRQPTGSHSIIVTATAYRVTFYNCYCDSRQSHILYSLLRQPTGSHPIVVTATTYIVTSIAVTATFLRLNSYSSHCDSLQTDILAVKAIP
jgi:hypothetical protein